MNEENIPIDINTTKLLEWLLSRRHVAKDWQNKLLNVRTKINNAIQDMPPHDGIIKLLNGQHINYFHCLKIVEILKETEKDTKNIFGVYGSQRMKDWNDIINSYQKDNIYLAEIAQILIRNVAYEIPSLKKQIQKLEQTRNEYEKKIKEHNKTESVSLKEFSTACEELGIKGKNLKRELIELVKDLPNIYDKEVEKLKTVDPVIEFYKSFINFYSKQNDNTNILETLVYLIENGNMTTYEFIHGEKPTSIEEDTETFSNISNEDNSENDENKDNEEIDFGDDNTESIDWGDSCKDSFEIIDYNDCKEQIVVDQTPGGIAKGNKALSLLDNPKYREQVINDLLELEAFLKMRLYEMSTETDNILATKQLETAPIILEMQTLESIRRLLDSITQSTNCLMNKRTQHLFNIKHSPKYVDLLTKRLSVSLSVADKMKRNREMLEKKITEIKKEIEDTKPVVRLMVSRTKEMQKQIEEEISKKYNGRVTNIVGGVNML